VAQLLAQANTLFSAANAALANQDLATYAEDVKEAEVLVARAAALSGTPAPTATTLPPVTTTTPGTAKKTVSSTTVAKA
jgi:hypothetical protein